METIALLAAARDKAQYPGTARQRMVIVFQHKGARALARVAAWAPSKVNLILYNSVEGSPFRRTSEAGVERFIRTLVARGVIVTVRRSRGQDIDAACGQLRLKQETAEGIIEAPVRR